MWKSKGKTCMEEKPSHVKQLSLNHVCKIGLTIVQNCWKYGKPYLQLFAVLLTLSYSSEINVVFLRGILCPWKTKCRGMSSEGCAAHLVGHSSPHLLKWILLGRVWEPAVDYNGCMACSKFSKKCAKWPLLFAAGPHTQPVCKGQEGPKNSEGTSRPDFQALN